MLDCTTPAGLRYVEQQTAASEAVAHWAKAEVRHTSRAGAANVDALFFRADELVAIAEVKSRNLSVAELERFGSYLISEDKLTTGSELARKLGAPFLLVVALLKDNALLLWKVTDDRGRFALRFDVRRTATAASCNGGTALRENAYLPLGDAVRIR